MKIKSEQTENEAGKIKGWKRILIILSSVLLAILLGYYIITLISSKRMIDFFNIKLTQVKVSESTIEKQIYNSEAKLLDYKAFLTSQLSLLNSDSLNLILDLKDSSALLVIEGVTIHSTKLSGYKMSKFFKALTTEAYTQVFSKPFIVEGFDATIVKEPITIKQAPKDTIEAASFFEMPDTIINDFVAVSMILNYNFILTFQQEESPKSSKWTGDRFFFLNKRISKIKNDLQQITRLIVPQAEPEIRILMPKDDLVTIYRALPLSTQISIRLR